MRRVGFRALKKTLEAPYTTKVNNRVHTSRGTTRTTYDGCNFLTTVPYLPTHTLVLVK